MPYDLTTLLSNIQLNAAQVLTLDCKQGLCNITLQDSSFSTCVSTLGLERYQGGLALANDVPQDSLYDFDLELFCAPNFFQGIDYNSPVANLTGNLVFLQDGIVRRTGPGFDYYDRLKKRKVLDGYYFGGIIEFSGGGQQMKILCDHGLCEVILWTDITRACITGPSSRFVFNGIYINRSVPEDSLDDFDIDLYCTPPGAGGEIDYETQDPVKTIKAAIVQDNSRDGIVHLAMDGTEYQVFRISDGS